MGWFGTKKYVACSVLAAVAAVWHAFATREQFFPAVVYLASSKFSIAVLGNLGFALALTTYKIITMIFLGTLRDSELERINDKISQAVLETCLAMTIFRTDFTVSVVTMFVILSFVKIFHWLVQDRVDFVETTPNVSRLQHLRIVAFMGFLLAVDLAFLQFTLTRTLERGVSVHLLFAFEYAIQASTIVTTFAKYVLSVVDMAMEGRWEGKGVAVFYLELTLDLLHLMVYAAFFSVVFSHYGVPLYLVRDLWFTFRSFLNRLRDFLRYRRITANMDQRFPDATEEDLVRADHVCIICREELTAAGRNKKLSCNHVFHLHCLRSWLERQQSCPICRTSVLAPGEAAPAPAPRPAAAPAEAAAGPAGAGAPPAGGPPEAQAGAEAAGAPLGARDAAGRAGPGWHFGALGAEEGAEHAGAQPHRRRGYHAFGPAGGVYDAHQALQGYAIGPGQMAGYVVNQWVPATSMALFVPAGGLPTLQYAGQQNPADVAAAATAAAAAAAGQMQPLPGMVPLLPIMMPPILPPPVLTPMAGAAVGGGAAGGSLPGAADAAQQAAAAAAAAAAAVSLMAPGAPVMVPQPAGPGNTQALQQVLQQQLEALSAQLAALRQHQHQQEQQAAGIQHQTAAGQVQQASSPAAPAAAGASSSGGASAGLREPATASDSGVAPGFSAADGEGNKPAPVSSAAGAAAGTSAAALLPGVEPTGPRGPGSDAGSEQGRDGGSEAAELRRRRLQRFQGAEGHADS